MEVKKCTICQTEKPLDDFYTVTQRGKTRPISHCIECNRVKDRHPHNRWSRIRAQCRAYSIEFTVSREQYVELVNRPCQYCGASLLDSSGVTLDRIDRTKGYLPDNVLPCCWLCNHVKGATFTVYEMARIGMMFDEFRRIREEKGEPPLLPPQKWSAPKTKRRKYGRLIEREQEREKVKWAIQ